ncbi:MAG: hypothetical protein FJ118_08745 [Deltaproteobacteria bacterium]|nr:hypothetical protein [Deltaproteobacteria bacterium]
MRPAFARFRLFSFVCALCLSGALLAPGDSVAQGVFSWWGSAKWVDWSDWRGEVAGSVFLPRLESGSLTRGGQTIDLLDGLNFRPSAEPWRELRGVIYLDRLGFRLTYSDNAFFQSNDEVAIDTTLGVTMDLRNAQLGLDIDLIRFPSCRIGIDFDYYVNIIRVRSNVRDLSGVRHLEGDQPRTFGAHALVVPGRLKEVPITFRGRVRFPLPVMERVRQARITEWEIAGGVRPAIWETSSLGHTSFSVFIEGGFRQTFLTIETPEVDLKARWQGAFVEFGMAF